MMRRLGWSLSLWTLPVLLLLCSEVGGQERSEPRTGREVVLTTTPIVAPRGGAGAAGTVEDARPAVRENVLSTDPSSEEEKEEKEREKEKMDRSMEMLRNLSIDLRRPSEAPQLQPQAPTRNSSDPIQ